MRETKEVKLISRTVTVKALKVGEIKGFLNETERNGNKGTQRPIEKLLTGGIGYRAIKLMTGLDPTDIERLTPMDMEGVRKACRELNPALYQLLSPSQQAAAKSAETAAKAEWEASAALRVEFDSAEQYDAFREADAAGMAKVYPDRTRLVR